MDLPSYAAFLSAFSQDNLSEIDRLYAPDIDFADPMNQAQDRAHLMRIEKDLLKQLQNIRFEIHDQLSHQNSAVLRWTMHYTFRSKARSIEGTSYLRTNAEGLIDYQRDYWDASLSVYGEFPLLGLSMRAIRKILRVR